MPVARVSGQGGEGTVSGRPGGSRPCPAQPKHHRGCQEDALDPLCCSWGVAELRAELQGRRPERGGGARFQVVRLRWGAAAAGTAEEERGSQSRRSQRLFGEAAQSEFQETITLVETSFLWPGRVTWLGGDKRQAGPPLWAGSHPASCRHPPRSPEAKGAGGGRAGRQVPAGPPRDTHTPGTGRKQVYCPPLPNSPVRSPPPLPSPPPVAGSASDSHPANGLKIPRPRAALNAYGRCRGRI